jgi:hypothetical protein
MLKTEVSQLARKREEITGFGVRNDLTGAFWRDSETGCRDD